VAVNSLIVVDINMKLMCQRNLKTFAVLRCKAKDSVITVKIANIVTIYLKMKRR
jgi:hypothetical protein